MSKKLVFILLFLMQGIVSFSQAKNLQLAYFQAENYFKHHQTDSALSILKQNANNKEFTFLLIDYYLQKQDYTNALNYCNILKSNNIQESNFYFSRIYAGMGFAEEALAYLEKNLSSKNKKTFAEIMQTAEYEQINRTTEWRDFWQIKRYTKAEELYAEVVYQLKLKKYNAALEILNTSKVQETSQTNYLYAQAYLELENYQQAEKYISKCVDAKPLENKFLHLQFEIYKQQKNFIRAYTFGRRLLEIEQFNSQNLLQQAEICFLLGKYQEASELINFYLQAFPDSEQANYLLARISLFMHDIVLSLSTATHLLEINPSQPEYYSFRGDIYYTNEMWQLADYDFSMFLDIQPTDAEMNYKLGMTKYQLANYEKACYYWRRAATQKHKKAAEEFYKYCAEGD